MATPTTEITSAGITCDQRTRQLWRRAAHVAVRFPFLGNVVVLLSGTGGGVALILLSTPLLSRLYNPNLFGTLAVFTSVLSMLLTCSSLSYEMAIPLAEDDDSALDVLALSFVVLGGMTLLIIAAMGLFGEALVRALNCAPLRPYLWLLPVGFLGGGAYQILSYWALRKQAFHRIAGTRLSQGFATAAVQLGFGVAGGTGVGLLIGDVLGRLTGVEVLYRYASRSWRRHLPEARRLRSVAVQYRKFPKFNVTANLLTSISTNIPVLILSRFFGPGVAGLYALTYRVLRGPVSVLGQAVAQAFFAKAAALHRNRGQLSVLTERTTMALFTIGLPLFAFLTVDGPHVFARVFGERWRDSGAYAQLLAPWFLLWLVANPLSTLLTVRQWQGGTLLFAAAECTVQVAALLTGAFLGSDRTCIALLGGSAFCFSLVMLARFFMAGDTSALRVLKRAVWPALGAIGCSALISLTVHGTGWGPLVARFALMAGSYSWLVWKCGWLSDGPRGEASWPTQTA